jgi:hypothetical protein
VTAPAVNGNDPTVTDRTDVRRRMRVVRDGEKTPSSPGSAPKSAYTRAIPRDGDVHPVSKPSKVRDFASSHGGEAWRTFATSWPLTDQPSSLADVAKRVFPRRGEVASWVLWLPSAVVGVFRLAVCTLAWLVVLAVDGNKRAAVALTVLLLALGVHLVAGAVG